MLLEAAGLLLLIAVAAFLLGPLFKAARRQRQIHSWPCLTTVVSGQRARTEGDMSFPEHQVRIDLDGRSVITWCGSPDRAGINGYYDGPGSGPAPRADLAAERILNRHPVGAAISVWVNPHDLNEAYRVERELPLTIIASLAGAAFLALFGVVVWIVYQRYLLFSAAGLH